jgi:hypothetical protein
MKFFCFLTIFLLFFANTRAVEWSQPVTLTDTGFDAINPQAAMNSAGDSVAVWQRFNGANSVIQSSSLPFKGSWSVISQLSANGQDAVNADIAVDAENNAVAIWERFDGSNWTVQSAYFDASWNPAVNVSTPGQNAHLPQVAVDAEGNAYAIWQRYNGANLIIQAAVLSKGGSWSAPVNLSLGGQNAISAKIAAGANGDAIAIWTRSNGTNTIIQTATYSLGSWSSPFDLSATAQNALSPDIAINQTGEAVAVWVRSDGANTIVQSRTLSSGIWSAVQNLSEPGQNAFFPDVKINESGAAIAVWGRSNGSKVIVESSLYLDGSWSASQALSRQDQNASNPHPTIDNNGNAAVVWRQYEGSNTLIQSAQFFILNRSWVSYEPSSLPGRNALSPNLTGDTRGNSIAVWHRFDGSNYLIQAVFGLAIAPPPNIRTSQHVVRFIGQGDLVNTIDWNFPSHPGVSFRVYKENLNTLLQATGGTHFEEHHIEPGERRTYLITTIDYLNVESDPLVVIIP